MNTPRTEDLNWYKDLQEAGRIADCNQWEIERFRVPREEKPVNWVEFEWESGYAVYHQFDPENIASERRTIVDYDTAFDMIKAFHRQYDRALRNGTIDLMYVYPTDYWFVHDNELV